MNRERGGSGPAPEARFGRRDGRLPGGLDSHKALVIAATLVGLGVRVWLATRSEVWLDEANSVFIALAPLREFATVLGSDSSPPLFYVFLKAWAFLVPFDPFWLRVPALLFGCATIPLVWLIGSRMDRPLTGVFGAWLLAVNPLHSYYSEEIRMYSMMVFLGLIFYFAVFHILRRTGAALPAILAGAALAYTHYYGLIFVGAGILVALGVLRQRTGKLLLCGACIGLAFLPWLPVFLVQLDNPHHVAWIAPFWRMYPGVFGVLRTVQAFLPGGMKYPYVPLNGIRPQFIIALLGALPFIALASRTKRGENFSPLAVPLLVTGVTLLIVVIRSCTGSPVYLAGRSDIVVLPLFILILAMALSRLGSWPRAVFLVAWIALSGVELVGSAESLRKPGNVALSAAVDSAGCRTVIATGLAYGPVLFYQSLEEDGARVVPFPIDVGGHPGNVDPESYTTEDLSRDARLLAQGFPPGEGVCVLGTNGAFSGPLAEAFLSTDAVAREVGVFYPSLMPGSPYVLVTFSGS